MEQLVYIVDDEQAVREATSLLVRSMGFEVRTYESAQHFLDAWQPDWRGCLILDVRMPLMSGLDLQRVLEERGVSIPIIFVTGHGDVAMAVQAMRAGAVDFMEKPYNDQQLLDNINRALAIDAQAWDREREHREIAQRLDALTPREREVMERIVCGQSNKVVALELGLSERTVELHRSRVMSKTGCRSLAELVTLANRLPASAAGTPPT